MRALGIEGRLSITGSLFKLCPSGPCNRPLTVDDNVSVSLYCDVMLAGGLRDSVRYPVLQASMPFDVWISQEGLYAEFCSYSRCS